MSPMSVCTAELCVTSELCHLRCSDRDVDRVSRGGAVTSGASETGRAMRVWRCGVTRRHECLVIWGMIYILKIFFNPDALERDALACSRCPREGRRAVRRSSYVA